MAYPAPLPQFDKLTAAPKGGTATLNNTCGWVVPLGNEGSVEHELTFRSSFTFQP